MMVAMAPLDNPVLPAGVVAEGVSEDEVPVDEVSDDEVDEEVVIGLEMIFSGSNTF